MNKNKNSKMTAIYRIRSACYDFLGPHLVSFTYLCEKKNRDEGSQHSSVFSLVFAGLKTFKVEPFNHFSLKILPGETLCNFGQIFPPKNLEKVRALKVGMRQLFFFKNLINNKTHNKETIKHTSFYLCLFVISMENSFFFKYGACVLGTPYFF